MIFRFLNLTPPERSVLQTDVLLPHSVALLGGEGQLYAVEFTENG